MNGEAPPLDFGDDDLFAVPPSTKPPATRRGDHPTSTQAAARVAADQETIRAAVHRFAKEAGPGGFIDADLIAAFPDRPESSYRKRRTELTADHLILDSGKTRDNGHGNREIVWVHRDHMPGVPCPTRLPEDQWAELKQRAKASAANMSAAATQAYAEGRTYLGHYCKEAADLLRQFAA